jgi:hypothetical protein
MPQIYRRRRGRRPIALGELGREYCTFCVVTSTSVKRQRGRRTRLSTIRFEDNVECFMISISLSSPLNHLPGGCSFHILTHVTMTLHAPAIRKRYAHRTSCSTHW